MSGKVSLPRTQKDEGFTLIELLVVCLLVPLVFGIVSALVVSATRMDETVRDDAAAASAGQVLAQSITRSVRQGDWLATSSTPSGQLLRVRTATNGVQISWVCRAWWFSDGAVWSRTSPSSIAAPAAGDLRGWSMQADGVAMQAGTPVFVEAAGTLTLTFTVDSGGSRAPVSIATSVTKRQIASTGGTQCQ
jgi:type II secretory pathway pseudopilin PulG